MTNFKNMTVAQTMAWLVNWKVENQKSILDAYLNNTKSNDQQNKS